MTTTEFAHGDYADLSGLIFYGPPDQGEWSDWLKISDIYVNPLFFAMLDKFEFDKLRLLTEWNCEEGWKGIEAGRVPIAPGEAGAFINALEQLEVSDLAVHCDYAQACLRCAVVIREFLAERLERGAELFIEDD